jgi:hypothetical protein
MVDRVYLDLNKWITLVRQYKQSDDQTRLNKLEELDEVVCPLSVIHLMETASAGERQIDEMFDWMVKLSRNQMIAPQSIVENEEVRSKVGELLGKEFYMEDKVFGEGLVFALGGRHYDIKTQGEQVDEVLRSKLLDFVEGEEATRRALESDSIRDTFGKRAHENVDLGAIERIRQKNEQRFDDNTTRRKKSVIEYFQARVLSKFLRQLQNEIEPSDLQSMDHDIPKERLESTDYAYEWIQQFPSVFTFSTLATMRDMQKQRDIKANDINDLTALSVAIPYCDIVVTENFWTNLSNQVGLGSMYETHVTADIDTAIEQLY